MAKSESIILDQADQTIDLLVSQLFDLKKHVAKLRNNLANVSTPAPGNGNAQILSDEQIASLLTRRQMTRKRRSQ